MRYRICPYCGAALDPGEICDCMNNPKRLRIPGKSYEPKGGKEKQHEKVN